MNHVEAYAIVYGNALQAFLDQFPPERKHPNCQMPNARASARKCVEDFRDLIKGFPECAEQRDAPDLDPGNPKSGTF